MTTAEIIEKHLQQGYAREDLCPLCGFHRASGTHCVLRRIDGTADDWSDATGAELVCTVPMICDAPAQCSRLDGI